MQESTYKRQKKRTTLRLQPTDAMITLLLARGFIVVYPPTSSFSTAGRHQNGRQQHLIASSLFAPPVTN